MPLLVTQKMQQGWRSRSQVCLAELHHNMLPKQCAVMIM